MLLVVELLPVHVHNDRADDESTSDDGEDASGHLKAPGPGQVVGVRVTPAHPEILTLQPEGIISKGHNNRHDENTWKKMGFMNSTA